MTIVERAAYLKGLVEGLGVEPESRDGKLWSALTELLSDMAHEIEDLQSGSLDMADALDEVCEELSYLEEITDALDLPDHSWDDDDEDFDDDPDNIFHLGSGENDEEEEDPELMENDEDEEEAEIDGVLYDATCPSCGEEITFDEETLEKGSIRCPNCGEELEFDLGDEDEEEEGGDGDEDE